MNFSKTELANFFTCAQEKEKNTKKQNFKQPKNIVNIKNCDNQYYECGINLIQSNKVAVLILAGGSGTRLGFDLPKGMFVCGDINKSLFQIHVENLIKIQKENNVKIPLIIMTSDVTHNETVLYFKSNNNFGINSCDLYFFKQNSIPALTYDGEIIMETETKMSLSANGNGDIYESLISSGVYDKLITQGVEYLQIVSIDNILSKISDPIFFGLVKMQNVELGVKAIAKKHDFENVGVFCEIDDKLNIIEYSEIGEKMASQKDDNNNRIFDCANISSYIIKLKAMYNCATKYKIDYHIARKNIKTNKEIVKGIKLELFIFDLFRYFNTYVIAKVDRNFEFSPIKNKIGEDSPETAIRDYKFNLA